jgi:hypothetical protein
MDDFRGRRLQSQAAAPSRGEFVMNQENVLFIKQSLKKIKSFSPQRRRGRKEKEIGF